MRNRSSYSAFTLVELVIVIVLLAILAATALPRFSNLTGNAQTSANKSHIGSFRAAVGIAHGIWLAGNNSGAANIIFAEGGTTADLAMSATGWPLAAASGTTLNCTQVWDIIMQETMANASYSQAAAAPVCTYTGPGNRTFTYNSNTGAVQ